MLRNTDGPAAVRGGLDLTISLTVDQADALGVDAIELAESLDTVLVGLAALRTDANPVVPDCSSSMKDRPVTAAEAWDQLIQDAARLARRMQGVVDAASAAHNAHGGSYGELAAVMGAPRATVQSLVRRVREVDPGYQTPEQLWVIGEHGHVRHEGDRVLEHMRSWSLPWHAYTPVDITPPELRPEGLVDSVDAGWAEPYASPAEVPDWSERIAAALIPFGLDDRRYPLNPWGRTGRTGRNLGKWGENQAADPVVVAGTGANRRVLLIERGDIGEWAILGGMVDPG